MERPYDLASLTARAAAGEADAQYALAAALSRSGRRDEAEKWLNSAAENGCADPLYTLGTRLLSSLEQAVASAEKLQGARTGGSAAASRLFCVLAALGIGAPKDEHDRRREMDRFQMVPHKEIPILGLLTI